MGYKYATLRRWNYPQKIKTKYCWKCTLKERGRHKRFIIHYFQCTLSIGGGTKDRMEARWEGMQDHSTSTGGPQGNKSIDVKELFVIVLR